MNDMSIDPSFAALPASRSPRAPGAGGSQSHVDDWERPEYRYLKEGGRCFQTMIRVDDEEEE